MSRSISPTEQRLRRASPRCAADRRSRRDIADSLRQLIQATLEAFGPFHRAGRDCREPGAQPTRGVRHVGSNGASVALRMKTRRLKDSMSVSVNSWEVVPDNSGPRPSLPAAVRRENRNPSKLDPDTRWTRTGSGDPEGELGRRLVLEAVLSIANPEIADETTGENRPQIDCLVQASRERFRRELLCCSRHGRSRQRGKDEHEDPLPIQVHRWALRQLDFDPIRAPSRRSLSGAALYDPDYGQESRTRCLRQARGPRDLGPRLVLMSRLKERAG